MKRSICNWRTIEVKRRVVSRFSFTRKYDVCSLFVRIWIERHFPLKCPVIYSEKIAIQILTGFFNVKNSRENWSVIIKQFGYRNQIDIDYLKLSQVRTDILSMNYNSVWCNKISKQVANKVHIPSIF